MVLPASSGPSLSATNFVWKAPSALPKAGLVQAAPLRRSHRVGGAEPFERSCRPSSARRAPADAGLVLQSSPRHLPLGSRSPWPQPAAGRRSPAGPTPRACIRGRKARHLQCQTRAEPPIPCTKATAGNFPSARSSELLAAPKADTSLVVRLNRTRGPCPACLVSSGATQAGAAASVCPVVACRCLAWGSSPMVTSR